MEFENQYLTYEEYVSLGGTLHKMPFNLSELEARTNIDRYSMSRLKEAETIPEEVKLCMFKLIEGMNKDANYKDSKVDEQKRYIRKIIMSMLSEVIYDDQYLLYTGVEC